jgi:hypothetical protein
LEREMTGSDVHVSLTAAEWRFVSALREVPPSPLKERIDTLLSELLAFARDPRCGEAQADGVPCASPKGDCESCRKVTEVIDTLRNRLAED